MRIDNLNKRQANSVYKLYVRINNCSQRERIRTPRAIEILDDMIMPLQAQVKKIAEIKKILEQQTLRKVSKTHEIEETLGLLSYTPQEWQIYYKAVEHPYKMIHWWRESDIYEKAKFFKTIGIEATTEHLDSSLDTPFIALIYTKCYINIDKKYLI